MSTIELVEVVEDRTRPVPAVLSLAWHEGLRMTLHPLVLVAAAWGCVVAVLLSDNGTRDAFDAATAATTFFLGVPVYFAANLVASRDRRAHSGELLAATPVPQRTRVVGLLLGCGVPAAAALGLVLLGHTVLLTLDLYAPVPSAWHLVTGPVTVLGAALLGVMVSRWFPVPGAAALVMVGMVAWNVATTNNQERYQPLGTYMSWARWNETPDWAGFYAGSPSWHVAYLLGLCAMAATGALLPGARSKLQVLLVGGALTALTGVLASVQLT